jgi:hypothetical protein
MFSLGFLSHLASPTGAGRRGAVMARERMPRRRSGAAVPVFREVISLCSESLFLTGQRAVLQVVFAVYNCLLIRTRNTNTSTRIFPGKRGALSSFKAWTRLGEGRRRRGGRHRDPAFARRGLDGLGADVGHARAMRVPQLSGTKPKPPPIPAPPADNVCDSDSDNTDADAPPSPPTSHLADARSTDRVRTLRPPHPPRSPPNAGQAHARARGGQGEAGASHGTTRRRGSRRRARLRTRPGRRR